MKRRDFIKAAVAAVTGASAAVKAAGAKKIMVKHKPDIGIPRDMSTGLFMETADFSTNDSGTYPDFIV